MSQLFPPPSRPSVGPEWSTWIIIVAVLFLVCVVAFYYYVR
jgi:uncharacterized protein YpmB